MKSFWRSPLFDALRSKARARRRSIYQQLECLEERCLLAQVPAVWIGGTGNWNNPANWDINTVPNNNGGTTYAVSIDGGAAGASNVTLDITVTIDSLTVSAGDSLSILDARRLDVVNTGVGTGTINNSGNIALNSGGNFTDLRFVGDVTLSGGGTITMSDNANNRIYAATNTNVLTNVDNTIQGSGQLGANTLRILNQGLILANSSNTLVVDPTDGADGVVNTGVMRATGTRVLQLAFGIYTNTNGDIEAGDASFVDLNNSTIVSGTLNTTGTGVVRSINSATLNNLTNAGKYLVPDARNTFLVGTINNTGTISMESVGNSTDLRLSGNVMLTGGGTVSMGDNANNRIYGNSGSDRLTNVDNTIQGAGQLGTNQMLLTNQGTIIANLSNPLIVDPTDVADGVINESTMLATGGRELVLRFGSFTNPGTIRAEDASTVTITQATIVGGTLETVGTGVIRSGGGATLDGVTNTGSFRIPDAVSATLIGTINNSGTISLNSIGNFSDLRIGGNVTLLGGGAITMSNNSNNRIFGNANTDRLTNVDNTISGAGNIGSNFMKLLNQGTIIANQTTQLVIDPNDAADGVTNEGELRAAGAGSVLNLTGGTFTNTLGEIRALDGAFVDINSATVIGGILDTAGTGRIRGNNAGLTDIINEGHYLQRDATNSILTGTITNNGTIELASIGNFTDLRINGTVTLQGGGTVTMSDNANNRFLAHLAPGTDKLINVDNTIEGSGNIGNNGVQITNQGTIRSTQSTPLIVDPSDNPNGVINEGLLQATGTSTLILQFGLFNNSSGVIEAIDSAAVVMNQSTITGGTLHTDGNGVIRSGGTVRLDGVTNAGLFVIPDATNVVLSGTITNSGLIQMNSVGNFTDLRISGDVTLTGGGTISMMGNNNNRIFGNVTGTEVLTNVNNTILGPGQLGANFLRINNQGTIEASQGTLNLDVSAGAGAFTNSGTVLVDPGATLQMGNGDQFVQTAGFTTVNGTLNSNQTVDIQGGVLNGSGTVNANVTNAGQLGSGTAAGNLTINGTYTVSGTGGFDIQIGGTAPGTQYDQLTVNGSINLNGPLNITLINGFQPSVNDTFTIINKVSAGDVTGEFDNLDEGDTFLVDGDTYRINYKSGDGNDVVLTVVAVKTSDFGDAPDSYGTLLASNGARHIGTGPRLGTNRDLDADGQPNATATGDDTHGVDDEDGVTLPASITQGQNVGITVAASGVAVLDAWIDFNRDGDFNDAGEQIFQNQAVSAAAGNLSFNVPATASVGTTYARFRVSSAGNLSPTGEATDGEVEDYTVDIAQFVPTLNLDLGGGAVTWIKKQPPVVVLPQATVTGTGFNGGSLVLHSNVVATKKKTLDSFSFPSANAIGTTQGPVVANGNITLSIQLNENATAASIQSFLRGITFSTKGKGLKTATRSLVVTLTDGSANQDAVTQTINVKKKA